VPIFIDIILRQYRKGKMVTDNSVKEQLRQLVALQKVDAEIYQYRRELKEKPAALEEMKKQFEAKKARLKELEDAFKADQVRRKEFELELQSKEDNIAKANTQLSQIKTNKEYTAKISEIENLKADMSVVEEKILMSFDQTDKIKSEIDQEKEVLATEEKKYQEAKQQVESEIEELKKKVQGLEQERQGITPGIEKTMLSRYEKILVNKNGLAIVPRQGSSCGGCYMNIPAQVINEIKIGDKIIFCEMCARILYDQDET